MQIDMSLVVWLLCAWVLGFGLGYLRGINAVVHMMRELEAQAAASGELQVRADLLQGCIYLYDITNGGERFLVQGATVEELLHKVETQFGDLHFRVVAGDARHMLRQYLNSHKDAE
jgi:hypothetical protein|nr:hypothetical protein [Oxalobacteraceae bacterium]